MREEERYVSGHVQDSTEPKLQRTNRDPNQHDSQSMGGKSRRKIPQRAQEKEFSNRAGPLRHPFILVYVLSAVFCSLPSFLCCVRPPLLSCLSLGVACVWRTLLRKRDHPQKYVKKGKSKTKGEKEKNWHCCRKIKLWVGKEYWDHQEGMDAIQSHLCALGKKRKKKNGVAGSSKDQCFRYWRYGHIDLKRNRKKTERGLDVLDDNRSIYLKRIQVSWHGSSRRWAGRRVSG